MDLHTNVQNLKCQTVLGQAIVLLARLPKMLGWINEKWLIFHSIFSLVSPGRCGPGLYFKIHRLQGKTAADRWPRERESEEEPARDDHLCAWTTV